MAARTQRILSLCTGYGGLELGLEIAGVALQPLVYVEREVYAAANLVARMEDEAIPEAPIWDCVDTFDATALHGIVDGIVGGYPCQPFSVAGNRLGTKDPRHLWPHFARIIRECQPRWCFFENVSNHLRLGFKEVAEELRAMGYRVAATLVTASEVGAPHKRERLFILAYDNDSGLPIERESCEAFELDPSGHNPDRCSGSAMADPNDTRRRLQVERRNAETRTATLGGCATVADSNSEVGRGEQQSREQIEDGRPGPQRSNKVFPPGRNPDDSEWNEWPHPCVESEIRERSDGHPYWVDELRLNGGGVVPLQAAYALRILWTDLQGDENNEQPISTAKGVDVDECGAARHDPFVAL